MGVISGSDGYGHAIQIIDTRHEAVVEHQETSRRGRVVFGGVVVFPGWDGKKVVIIEKGKAVVLGIQF